MNQVSLDASVRIPDDVIFRELDGEAILLNLATGIYFGLDQVGTRVWTLLAEHMNVRAVVEAMSAEYDVDPTELQRDVLTLTAELLEKSLVTLDPSSATAS